MRIYPVILCGGSGTRLWPVSRPSRPKQFAALIGDRSLFQNTVTRLQGLVGGQQPIIVAGKRHAAEIERQLAELGVKGVVITEPEGRDSAPAIAAAAQWIAASDPQGIAVVVASDHHIPDAQAFCASVAIAAVAAAQGRIVTFGVRPAGPATAYGYIQPADALDGAPGVFALDRFIEKPDAATARDYVAAGYLWNSGNFVFAAQTLLDELAVHAPEVTRSTAMALDDAECLGDVVELGATFRTAPKVSIDYALMEKTVRAAVAPVSFGWSDLGAWDAVWAASDQDAAGNAQAGDALLVDSRNCLIRSEGGPLVVGVGLDNLAVIAQPDCILVCALGASQGVKLAVDQLKADARAETDIPQAPAPDLSQLKRELQLWLHSSAWPVWWTLGADHAGGGFYEALDEAAQPVLAPRRARVQARQIYSYAMAGLLAWRGPWREAVDHGMAYFSARYLRSDGLYRTLTSVDGAVADDTAMVYDQAFALLAFAAVAKAVPERATQLSQAASRLLTRLKETHGAAAGFAEPAGVTPYQSDPQMHLLEAALAWAELDGGQEWEVLADAQAELGLARLIDPTCGAIKENFDADWRPAAGEFGRLFEPGHQFEWAWLLERWGRRRSRADALAQARRLFDLGERGVDPRAGVAMNDLRDDFSIIDAGARLWPQTERLKAALILAEDEPDEAGRLRYLACAAQAAQALTGYFQGVVPGLWRDKRRPEGGFVHEPAPASSLYHIVCAISELGPPG